MSSTVDHMALSGANDNNNGGEISDDLNMHDGLRRQEHQREHQLHQQLNDDGNNDDENDDDVTNNNDNHESEDENNDDDDDGTAGPGFPATAAGAFDDDAFSQAAAGVTYGPNFYYPTDEDFALPPPGADGSIHALSTRGDVGDGSNDANLLLPNGHNHANNNNSNNSNIPFDRRWLQQVLDLHAAAQQPEPLHELAILAEAEQQPDLLAALPPIGTAFQHPHHGDIGDDGDDGANLETREAGMESGAAAGLDVGNDMNDPLLANNDNHIIHNNDSFDADMDRTIRRRALAETQRRIEQQALFPANNNNHNSDTSHSRLHQLPVEAFPLPPSPENRKRPLRFDDEIDNKEEARRFQVDDQQQQRQLDHSDRRHSRNSNLLKKRRFNIDLPPLEPRKQMEDALEARLSAQKSLQKVEEQWSRLQASLQDARNTYEKAVEDVQTTTQNVCDALLLEDTAWNANYRLLRNYHRQHGHVNIPRRWNKYTQDVDFRKLGRWAGENRRNYKRSLDDPERIEEYQILALERLGFDWDPKRTTWHKRYQQLKAFQQKHGHTRIPYRAATTSKRDGDSDGSSDDDEDNDNGESNNEKQYRRLGSWIKNQRYQYKLYQESNPTSDMTLERINLLNDIDFEWKIRGDDSSWKDYYNQLQDYYHKHGHTLVPCSNKILCDWTNSQRQQYRIFEEDPSESDLSEEQFKLLRNVGLSGDLREGKWFLRFGELLDFKEKHGHCVVPAKYACNPQLSNWCAVQRRHYRFLEQGKKSQLTSERVQILEDAGFEWVVSAQRRVECKIKKTWEESYSECFQHYQAFACLDGIFNADVDLDHWCQDQLVQYQRFIAGQPSSLSMHQKEQLDNLGFSSQYARSLRDSSLLLASATKQATKSWEELYADLLVYRLNHNSFSLPDAEKYYDLHSFVREQRREYIKFKSGQPSLLTSERVRKLQAVRFPFKAAAEKKAANVKVHPTWEEMFAELMTYRLKYQMFDVSRDDKPMLYKWIQEQRQIFHELNEQGENKRFGSGGEKMELMRRRIEKLEEINFPWL